MKRTYRLAFVIPACATMLLSVPALGRDGVAINLPDKRVAVLSEGDLEPASGGSYSIAVFKDRDLVDFLAGAVFSRDGSFFQDNGKPRAEFADITGDGTKDLILSKLTAGSGNYLEADALRIEAHSVKLLVRVQTDTNHNVVAALKAAYKRGSRSPQ
ncbi:PliI family lysozyme inhibitor of I-type lysozyme [Burkholderia pseudomallei]|uniref:PliI family lysozyme inhibitor of I-type lysozyme n=1 Tax=Burkholderia pseudomallei TaxID=28450 RepID=UPI0031401693